MSIALLAGGSFGLYNAVTQDINKEAWTRIRNNPSIKADEDVTPRLLNIKKELYKDNYYNLILAGLCFGTLGFLGLAVQNKKSKKQSLKPLSITEVLSLPIDTILKYRWTASAVAGIAAISQLQPNQENMKIVFGQSQTIYNSIRTAAGLYGTIPLCKLFLEQMAIFKKPSITSFPKAAIYSFLGLNSFKFHKKALEQMEDCLEKRIEEQTTNLETDEDRACYNLTKLLEEKINDNSNLDIFTKTGRMIFAKFEEYRLKKNMQKYPKKALAELINLQQSYLLLNNKKKSLNISKKILTECQKHEFPLPFLINQAKILKLYNQDNKDVWKKAILTLIRKYSFKNDFRKKGGSQSEVFEIKKEATVSGSNMLMIEISDDRKKVKRVYEVNRYLSSILDITPTPLRIIDTKKLSKNSDEFMRRYYLFMERKPGNPIDLNDLSFLEKNAYLLLEKLSEYQTKATANLENIQTSIPVLNCEDYFNEKFLDRIKVDKAIRYLFQKGSEPVIDYLQHQKPYFNHFNLHEKNILQNKETITGIIDSEDATLASFGMDLGFLANYLKFGDQLVQPYYKIFGKKQGFSKKEFAKQAYSAMVLATAGLVGRNIVYREGREGEFLVNLHNFAEKLLTYYPKHPKNIKMLRKALDYILP